MESNAISGRLRGCTHLAQISEGGGGKIRDDESVAAAGQEVAHLSFQNQFAFAHDGDVFAERFDFAEQVGIDEDGNALTGEPVENVANFAAAGRIDAVGRLVEN